MRDLVVAIPQDNLELQAQLFMIVGKSWFYSGWLSLNVDVYVVDNVCLSGPGVSKPSVTGLIFFYDEGATRYAAFMEIQQR